MTPERWARLKELFSIAVESGGSQDNEMLDALRRAEPSMADELTAMVKEHRRLQERPADARETLPADLASTASGRFYVLDRVGSGSFGDVYKAYDEQRGAIVAVKILRETRPSALLYFKREFRSLAGIEHPNLVRLYELIFDGDRWMFTMEFLEGSDFLRHVTGERGGYALPYEETERRVRAALPQLASAVGALHQQGLLHRDLKPSNVMVSDAGRVSVLDFGLVRELGEDGARGQTIAGTPDYMSPEQANGLPLTTASDWYSVGVMLYEALTGRLPFPGSQFEVVRRKQTDRPIPPRELEPQVAEDLNGLCIALLDPDPEERMRAADSLVRLSGVQPTARVGTLLSPDGTSLVGRDRELQRLIETYQRSVQGHAIAVHVYGPSGIGKSVLVREFLTQLRVHDPSALVFAGRCYQSESVPFQGLDDLIDSIAQYLRRLPAEELGQMLPRNFPLMVRMFPVLGQLRWLERRAALPLDSGELRSRAFSAAREMLGRIADRRRLVLVIDDLQWGDLDSCAFIKELTGSLEAPVLLVLAYRSEDIEAVSWLKSLHAAGADAKAFAEHVHLPLSCLSEVDTAELVRRLATGKFSSGEGEIRAVVEQSDGDPFLIHELVRSFGGSLSGSTGRFDVEAAFERRFEVLPQQDRLLLELVAVSGQPVAIGTLKHRVATPDLLESFERLTSHRLLRYRSTEGQDEVEVYHDRIRSAVLRTLNDESMRARHADLAGALEEAGSGDPERLALHYWGAGNGQRAASYSRVAARRAADALAFNKAAHFLQLILETGVADAGERAQICTELGDSLSSAGRGAEAADAYIRAANDSLGLDRLRLLGLAAGQFLRSGYAVQGRRLLREIFRETGIGTPQNPILQVVLVAMLRLRIRIRGLDYRERPAAQISAERLLRIDLCGIAALGLAMNDPLSSAEFSARYLLLALQAGEPYRAALALAGEATQVCHGRAPGRYGQARILLERAAAIAARLAHPHAEAFVVLMSAVVSYFEGSWKRCVDECETALDMLRAKCTGINWELSTANTFSFVARCMRGEWSENRRRLPQLVTEAEGRGDLYASISLRILGCAYLLDLAAGDPERAKRDLERDLGAWPDERFDPQRANALLARIDIALYCGSPEEAWSWIEREWKLLERSGMLNLPTTFAFSYSSRGRAALAMARHAAETGRPVEAFISQARHSAQQLLRLGPEWSHGLAHLLLAGAGTFGDSETVQPELETAARLLEEADLAPFRAVALYRLAGFVRSDEAAALRKRAEQWTSAQEISDPRRILGGLNPGRWPD